MANEMMTSELISEWKYYFINKIDFIIDQSILVEYPTLRSSIISPFVDNRHVVIAKPENRKSGNMISGCDVMYTAETKAKILHFDHLLKIKTDDDASIKFSSSKEWVEINLDLLYATLYKVQTNSDNTVSPIVERRKFNIFTDINHAGKIIDYRKILDFLETNKYTDVKTSIFQSLLSEHLKKTIYSQFSALWFGGDDVEPRVFIRYTGNDDVDNIDWNKFQVCVLFSFYDKVLTYDNNDTDLQSSVLIEALQYNTDGIFEENGNFHKLCDYGDYGYNCNTPIYDFYSITNLNEKVEKQYIFPLFIELDPIVYNDSDDCGRDVIETILKSIHSKFFKYASEVISEVAKNLTDNEFFTSKDFNNVLAAKIFRNYTMDPVINDCRVLNEMELFEYAIKKFIDKLYGGKELLSQFDLYTLMNA